MEQAECLYCGREVDNATVPSLIDDVAWEQLAEEHAGGCEWIETRGHQIPDGYYYVPGVGLKEIE